MASSVFNLIVIGSGPAGQKAALQAAKAGHSVAMIEEYPAVGGWCTHSGTLPSKSFRESVYRYSLSSRGVLGQEGVPLTKKSKKADLPDMKRLLQRKDRVVSNEAQIIYDQLKRNGVKVFHGRAKLLGDHQIEVKSKKGTQKITGDFIFIAVGARPAPPVAIEVDGKDVLDSSSILNLKLLPQSLAVLGAGIIGCEYASMFSMAGTHVHLIDRRADVLDTVDREVVDHLLERFMYQGMQIHLKCDLERVERSRGKLIVRLNNGESLKVDKLLCAQGRIGNTENLGLESVGIQPLERGLLVVNRHFQTSVSYIYAVGDVIGAPALASTSMEQGRMACRHAFKIPDDSLLEFFPYGIYTIPEISIVGQTQEELVLKKVDFVVGKSKYRELARGQIVGDRWGLLKILVDTKTLKLLGVHIVGDGAADLIHVGQAVMALGGDVNYFIRSVFNYPTLAEAYKNAAFHAINQLKPLAQKSPYAHQ